MSNFGHPDNRKENIVEIVGDSAGQIADGFHLLGLPKLRFELQLEP